jgi:hypothetical protein
LYLAPAFLAFLAVRAIRIAESIQEFAKSMETNPTLSANLRSPDTCASYGWQA